MSPPAANGPDVDKTKSHRIGFLGDERNLALLGQVLKMLLALVAQQPGDDFRQREGGELVDSQRLFERVVAVDDATDVRILLPALHCSIIDPPYPDLSFVMSRPRRELVHFHFSRFVAHLIELRRHRMLLQKVGMITSMKAKTQGVCEVTANILCRTRDALLDVRERDHHLLHQFRKSL